LSSAVLFFRFRQSNYLTAESAAALLKWRLNGVKSYEFITYMNEENRAAIARLIKERRVAKNLTQQQFADLAGLSLRSIQRLEKGEVISRMYTLETVAKHLGLEDTFRQLQAAPASQAATKTGSAPVKKLSRVQKIIISTSTAFLITLLIMAYIFQSPRFPETAFEMVLLVACALFIYSVVLFFVWR
jgi:transcriptional regulator with XRE-family HTH domain